MPYEQRPLPDHACLRIFPCNYAQDPAMTAPAIKIAAILGGRPVLKRTVNPNPTSSRRSSAGCPRRRSSGWYGRTC